MEFTMILNVFALILGFSFTIRLKTQSNAYTFIILYYLCRLGPCLSHIFLRVDILKLELFVKELMTQIFYIHYLFVLLLQYMFGICRNLDLSYLYMYKPWSKLSFNHLELLQESHLVLGISGTLVVNQHYESCENIKNENS